MRVATTAALRVMQSFGSPRPTTNPYIQMLDRALAGTSGIEHLRFDRRRALFGRYDVLHLHWPETLLAGRPGANAFARRLYVTALLTRLRLGRIAVVRTVHNVELPQDISRWDRRLLEGIDERTDLRILLNAQTALPQAAAGTVIPHGDFLDWFGPEPEGAEPPVGGGIAFVGLVRRYKGVERLIEAFGDTATTGADLQLRISGNPSSEDLAAHVRALAASDARVSLDLRYLDEPEFAQAIRAAEGIVLPYRFMHNSGSVLAALSLERPVLVPRNDVNEALSQEVGPGWVVMFDGELTADDLVAFLPRSREARGGSPRLDRRTWSRVGEDHRDAYRRAVEIRRGRKATP